MTFSVEWQHEWLEADGLGGFASGTTVGIRTRRYHALLLVVTTPPTGRVLLVNGFEAWVETPAGSFALTSQVYAPNVVHPDGARRMAAFAAEPWPHWEFLLEDDTRLEHDLFVRHGAPVVALSWRLRQRRQPVMLSVRPLLSGRNYHALQHENPAFRFDAETCNDRVVWRPYPGVPGIVARSNGTYRHQPDWYRNFLYTEEQTRGLDHIEDLATPGCFQWDLSQSDAVWLLTVAGHDTIALPAEVPAAQCLQRLRSAEQQRRRRFPSPLHRAADAYVVQRGQGETIIARYPWFTDWGRDTFIALRGLCLATGRLDTARHILLEWAKAVSHGMLPNRFPDHGELPEFNAVDASLWYIVAVYKFLQALAARNGNWQQASGNSYPRPSTPFWQAIRMARAMVFGSMTMACWPPGSQGCSSPGWTSRSAIGS
jgi:predicted glycogen debranching enzyme